MVYLRGVEIARWEMRDDCLLAISSEATPSRVAGFRHQRTGLRRRGTLDHARIARAGAGPGYAVVDQTSVLATHLAEVIKQHAYELLTRQETKRLLDRLAKPIPSCAKNWCPS